MVLKVFIVQLILVQIISAEFIRNPVNNNVKNKQRNFLEDRPLAVTVRPKRQINRPVVGLPGNGNLPVNGLANGLPTNNAIPSGNFPRSNALQNRLAVSNGLPNNLNFNIGLLNNLPMKNGLSNNPPLPFANQNSVPIGRIQALINGKDSSGLPLLPNVLANLNGLPVNGFQNFNNRPAGNIFLNRNNLPAANPLPNINNYLPIKNGLNNFNNWPYGNTLPQRNGLPLSNLPSANPLLPNNLPFNNILPNMNNIRITGFGIGNDLANLNNFAIIPNAANNFQLYNGFTNINNLRNGFRYARNNNVPVCDDISSINNLKNSNGFPSLNNIPSVNGFTNNLPVDNGLAGINNFPIDNAYNLRNAREAQNINNILLNNNAGNHFEVNEPQLLRTNPLDIGFLTANKCLANTGIPNVSSLPANIISNGLSLPNTMVNNGGYTNDGFLAANGIQVNVHEMASQNGVNNGFSSNNLQSGNLQTLANNLPNDFVDGNPVNHNLLSDGIAMLANTPSDWQSSSTNSNFNLAQELVNNLQIEGFGNLPMINGLPVTGITEAVLNTPYNLI